MTVLHILKCLSALAGRTIISLWLTAVPNASPVQGRLTTVPNASPVQGLKRTHPSVTSVPLPETDTTSCPRTKKRKIYLSDSLPIGAGLKFLATQQPATDFDDIVVDGEEERSRCPAAFGSGAADSSAVGNSAIDSVNENIQMVDHESSQMKIDDFELRLYEELDYLLESESDGEESDGEALKLQYNAEEIEEAEELRYTILDKLKKNFCLTGMTDEELIRKIYDATEVQGLGLGHSVSRVGLSLSHTKSTTKSTTESTTKSTTESEMLKIQIDTLMAEAEVLVSLEPLTHNRKGDGFEALMDIIVN